jgi:hypothetical protein
MMVKTMLLGAAFLLAAGACPAETIAVDDGIAVRPSSVPSPTRGMTMSQVESRFGPPASKVPAVGKPPISRWDYAGFKVYFEYNHVIHSVAAGS